MSKDILSDCEDSTGSEYDSESESDTNSLTDSEDDLISDSDTESENSELILGVETDTEDDEEESEEDDFEKDLDKIDEKIPEIKKNKVQVKNPIVLKSSYEPMYIRATVDDNPKKKEILYPVFYELFLNIDDNFWKTVFINFAIGKFHHGFGYIFKYETKSTADFHHVITFRKGKNIIKKNLSIDLYECILEIQIFITNHTSMIIPKEALYFVTKNAKKEEKDSKNKKQQNRQQNKKSRIGDYIRKMSLKYKLTKEAEKEFRNLVAKYHLSGSITSNRIVYDKNETIETIKGIHYNEKTKLMQIDIPFKKNKKSKEEPNKQILSPTFHRDKSESSSTNLANKNWKKYLENISRNSKFIDKKIIQPRSQNH